MGFSYFKVPKHRVFNYQPVTYDPDKEYRERRKAELGLRDDDEADGNGSYTAGSLIKNGGMRARHEKFNQKMSKQRRKSQVFLVCLIVLFSLIAYYLMREYSDEFQRIFFKN